MQNNFRVIPTAYYAQRDGKLYERDPFNWDQKTVAGILERVEYEQEQKELKVKIVELEDLIENGETKTKDFKQLLANVRKYTDPQELTV